MADHPDSARPASPPAPGTGTGEEEKRRHVVPPPPHPHGRWWSVPELVGPGREALALALWKSLRAARDWAGHADPSAVAWPPGRALGDDARDEVARACEQVPELAPALDVFVRLRETPGQARAGELAEACRQVREWAEMEYRLELAVLFAEAAARVDRESAALANDAGRICRRATLHDSAGQWYQRGYRLGARVKNHDQAIRALLGYGEMMYELGQHDQARRFFLSAASRAARTGRRARAGVAHHNLLAIASDVGTYRQGERHTFLAFEHYPIRHPNNLSLAHDFAFLLIRNRLFSPALSVLNRVRPLMARPDLQALAWSNIGQAAAGMGQLDVFVVAKRNVLDLIGHFREFAPAALVNIAEGARACGDWEEAERCARMAIEMAKPRKDAEPERVAGRLLDLIAARTPAPPEAVPPPGNKIDTLIRLLTGRLQRLSAPNQRVRGQPQM